MHPLLRQQLRDHGLEESELPDDMRALLGAVDDAYAGAEEARERLEAALERASRDLSARDREQQTDVEARMRAEYAMQEKDAQTRAIFAALPDVMVVVSPEGEVREIHSPGPSFLSEPVSEHIGRSLDEVLPQPMFDVLIPAVARAAQDRKAQQLELSLDTGSRRLRYEARLTVSVLGDIVVVIRDQTERVRMAERLRVADRMASVGTLAAGVAHELNNPLAYVLGNLELMQEELRSPDRDERELRTLVEDAVDGARRMRAITQDLSTFSRPHADAVESVDPRAVMDSALRMAATEIRHRAGLCRDYEDVPPVLAEASKLGQVFLNLVINAVQALPVGDPSSHEIGVRTTTNEEGWAVVEVSDTGSGVPPHLRSRIFEPFVTTKPRGVGTGLGLSICHNIVTSLGGRISLHPRRVGGTTFRVALPPSERPVSSRSRSPSSAPVPVCGRRPRVLIIDDDALVATALRRLLVGSGEIVVAGDGHEGLQRLRSGRRFDVVLCDLMMPEISGMDVFETIEHEDPELASRFVFMTGGAFTDRARSFLERVPNRRLEKPFDSAQVRTLVWEHAKAS